MKTVLTIAGFDPSSGAGVTADRMVFAAHGLFGTACITALTVQSTLGVRGVHPVGSDVVAQTLGCLDEDFRPAGIKIGMTGSTDNINTISQYLEKYNLLDVEQPSLKQGFLVLDPVLRSSSGRELLEPAGVAELRDRLLPLVDWVTPNLEELAVLTEMPSIQRDTLPAACAALQARTARRPGQLKLGIFAKGGHMAIPDDYVLTPEGEGVWLPGERVETQSTHGTGCALSSAFLCRLVHGESAVEAARGAKEYVAEALRNAVPIGHGHGPMDHLWTMKASADSR